MSSRIHLIFSFVALLLAMFLVGCENADAETMVDFEQRESLPMEDAAWSSTPIIEGTNSDDAAKPEVAVDSLGNALAVWRQDSLDNSISIWAARFTPSGGWGSAELISIVSVGNKAWREATPKIAMAPSGRALVVWNERNELRDVIWANKFAPKKGWGAAQTIGDDTVGEAEDPRIAIDSRGNGMAVWEQGDSDDVSISDRSIWFNRFTPRNGWGNAEKVETETADYINPEIAMGPSGNALVIWEDDHNALGYSNIMASRYLRGRGWGPSELIEMDEFGSSININLEIDDSGNAIAVWELYDYNYFDVWASRFTPADGWSEAERIETFNSGDAVNSSVAFDPDGNAVVLWTQEDYPLPEEIWVNYFSPRRGWSGPELFERRESELWHPKIAFDSEGNGLAVWVDNGSETVSVWAKHFDAASGWGSAELVENDVNSPDIAIGPFGEALVVLRHYDLDGGFSIWASRFE